MRGDSAGKHFSAIGSPETVGTHTLAKCFPGIGPGNEFCAHGNVDETVDNNKGNDLGNEKRMKCHIKDH